MAWLGVGSAAAIVAAALHISAAAVQQTQDCSADARLASRKQAVQLARRINTAQARVYPKQQAYQPLDALAVGIPDGFAVQLVTSTTGYIFTVKASCGFGLFSDQNGVIYLGETLR